ncbi:MAG: hypothetical protein K0S41_1122 [Anaerocolumna sp.]|nr:hypothetical protein [Anaerocolumna sp.]
MIMEEFNKLKEEVKKFKYNSFEYIDFDDVADYEILHNDEKLILIYGLDTEQKQKKVNWAANYVDNLTETILGLGKDVLISFIPMEWRDHFFSVGFMDYAMFREYWIDDITCLEGDVEYHLLQEDECEQAAFVTQSCRLQSRGFLGETKDFFLEWINGRDASAINCNAINSSVLVHKNDDKIVGIACVTIYGFESKKGPILWLREIAVHPEYQGKGIGRKLIRQAIQFGKEREAIRSFLMADDCNENAIGLYKSIGYVPNDDVEINMIS